MQSAQTSQLSQTKEQAQDVDKIFWLISESHYQLLRELDGCDGQVDLPATVTDNDHIIAIADNLGVPQENRFIDINPTFKKLKTSYKDVMKLSRKLTNDGKPHVIFVYAGGHGATDNEQQLFLLNSNDPSQAYFHLEYKLRVMVADILTLARIFGVFDCCRVPLKNLPGLAAGRGGGNQGGDTIEEEEDDPNKYFHIQACGPGGIAAADGGFAKRLLDCCIKFSQKEPEKGFMSWPSDFSRVKWKPGEMHTEGGDSYLMPFGPHAAKFLEESKSSKQEQPKEESKNP